MQVRKTEDAAPLLCGRRASRPGGRQLPRATHLSARLHRCGVTDSDVRSAMLTVSPSGWRRLTALARAISRVAVVTNVMKRG